jgi:hypothetical protein
MPFDTMYLALVIIAFSTFALTLGGVAIWSSAGAKAQKG